MPDYYSITNREERAQWSHDNHHTTGPDYPHRLAGNCEACRAELLRRNAADSDADFATRFARLADFLDERSQWNGVAAHIIEGTVGGEVHHFITSDDLRRVASIVKLADKCNHSQYEVTWKFNGGSPVYICENCGTIVGRVPRPVVVDEP